MISRREFISALVRSAIAGGVFAYVSLYRTHDQAEVVSPLYAADLGGGCVGSIIASLVLIPFGGLDITM